MGKDDSLTIRVNDDSDSIVIAMESQSQCLGTEPGPDNPSD